MKHGRLFPLLVVLSALALTAPVLAEDHGAPDSIYFAVPNPPTQPGTFAVELWVKNDADTLVGVSAGFKWTNDNMVLDSVRPAPGMFDATIFYDSNRDITNLMKHFLYVGIAFSTPKLLQPDPAARRAATYYFTLSSWLPGDEIVIDTNEFQIGAEFVMSGTQGLYTPQFGGPVRITYNPLEQHTWYVAIGGDDDTGIGTMANPFRTIQFAINTSSEGDSVIVAPGTYHENIVYGGKNIVVGSYYIMFDDDTAITNTIIDGSTLTRGDSTGSVVSIVDGETDARLEGFTIRGGIGTKFTRLSGYYAKGGGILVQNASARLAFNIVENNSLTGADCQGGGIYVEGENNSVYSNTIRNNNMYGTNANYGGGLCVSGSPISHVSFNVIETNDAAGIAYIDDANGVAEYNRINGNGAQGIFLTNEGTHTFRENAILRNDSAGIYANYASPRIENNVIAGNMQGIVSRASSMTIIGNTIAYNHTTGDGGGLYHFWDNHATFDLQNNIFWGNTADTGTSQIVITAGDATLNVSCCDVDGGLTGVRVADGVTLNWQDNNIDLNPEFCDSFVDDYHIANSSPCRAGAPENLCGTLMGAVGVGCGSDTGGRTWLVKADGSGDVPTIQLAVDSALAGDTILVGPGLYTGEGNTDVFIDAFKLNGNGGNSLLVVSQNGPSETIIDAEGSGRGFFVQGPLDFNMTIDGFTFRNGSTGVIAGGAIRCFGVAALITRCVFYDNECNYGGAIYFNGYETPHGALSVPVPRVVGCTFFGNRALTGSAIYFQYNGLALTIERSIFMANQSSDPFPPVATLDPYTGGATVTLSCCDIFGNQGGDWTGIIAGQANVQGNFSADPLFCDPAAGSFSINIGSPCTPGASPCGSLVGACDAGCATLEARTWYVDVHGSDSIGDGTVEHPFATIQHAIDMSKDFDTVQVAPGGYYGNGNRDIDFLGKKILVRSQDGYENATIDCRPDPDEYPGYHRAFIFQNEEQSNSIIDGFRIIHGNMSDSLAIPSGGAVYCGSQASPTIRNCLFAQNQCSGLGGAVFASQGTPNIIGCVFDHNRAYIGGALTTLAGGFVVDQCSFRGNTAIQSGGAIFVDGAQTFTLQNSVFFTNASGGEGSVVTLSGFIYAPDQTAAITPYEVIGCTFADNMPSAGTCFLVKGTQVSFERTIIAYTRGVAVTCEEGDAIMECCDVYGNTEGDWVGCIEDDGNNKSNFSMDPMFCNRAVGDYRIDATSPCAPANTWCEDLVGALGVGCSGGSRIVWYVDPNGSDEYGDGSPESPFATIQHAIDMSSTGDSVFVRPGTYRESLNYLGKNITVRSIEGPMRARITNERTVNLVTFDHGENADAVLEGFTLEGGWIAVLCINSGPTIRHNVMAGQNVWNWSAVALSGTPVIFDDPTGDPRYSARVGPAPAVIINNTIVNCANGGISTFSSIPPVIRNNIIAFNQHYAIHKEGIMDSVAYPILGYNDVFGNPVAYQELPEHGPGAIEADPLFGRYFSLGPGSPCIDAGDPDPMFNDPDGSRNDMGAIPAADNVVVIPTDQWINIYCDHPMIDSLRPPQHSTLRAYDPDGVLCGIGTLRDDYSFGFIPIYHDDIYTEVDEGAVEGDLISFTINGQPVTVDPPIYWTENGDSFAACQFSTERCLTLELHQGWNLVSWNVAYSDAIEAAIDGIRDCVDVVMSFDRGGLTYDPALAQFSTLQAVDYRHGYWFRMNCDATLEICGQDVMQTQVLEVFPGWNLVSYWPQQDMSLDQGFGSILDHLLVATGFDNGALTWVSELDQFNTLTNLKPGLGYWVKTDAYMPLVYPGFMVPITPDAESGRITSNDQPASRYWISAYGENLTIDDVAVPQGATFEFYTQDGTLCGQGACADGKLNFTPVYGSDDITDASKQYADHGSAVIVKVDGVRVYPDLNWTENGARVQIGALSTSSDGLPASYALSQNYPNPFNPTTMIDYSLPKSGHVTLEVFNVLGQKVRTLVDGFSTAGPHTVEWDGQSDNGAAVSSGVYLYRIQASEFTQTRKMVLMK